MAKTEQLQLSRVSLNDQRQLTVHRFGEPGTRPKVYVQAGIHANELAAPLTAHHLAGRLTAAEVVGEIIVVPIANPIGLSQIQSGEHFGRHDLETGGNYNRAFFDTSRAVLAKVEGQLGDDAADNTKAVRAAVAAALGEIAPRFAIDDLHLELQKLAFDADIVLDLHTDSDAEMHLFVDPTQWPEAEDLAAELGIEVVMLARASGSNPFEETIAAPYVAVHEAHGGVHPIAVPLTAVVELRGLADVSDELAGRDADAIMRFLQRRGCLAGEPGARPPFTGIAAPFEQTAFVWASAPGIVSFKKPLGAMVEVGDVVAEIIDVSAISSGAARTPVLAETSGRFFARSLQKLARPGQDIGKIFGTTPIAGRTGHLLSD